jgi:hypothetical protein
LDPNIKINGFVRPFGIYAANSVSVIGGCSVIEITDCRTDHYLILNGICKKSNSEDIFTIDYDDETWMIGLYEEGQYVLIRQGHEVYLSISTDKTFIKTKDEEWLFSGLDNSWLECIVHQFIVPPPAIILPQSETLVSMPNLVGKIHYFVNYNLKLQEIFELED